MLLEAKEKEFHHSPFSPYGISSAGSVNTNESSSLKAFTIVQPISKSSGFIPEDDLICLTRFDSTRSMQSGNSATFNSLYQNKLVSLDMHSSCAVFNEEDEEVSMKSGSSISLGAINTSQLDLLMVGAITTSEDRQDDGPLLKPKKKFRKRFQKAALKMVSYLRPDRSPAVRQQVPGNNGKIDEEGK